jgi:alpha-1,2-mannosyltransferase
MIEALKSGTWITRERVKLWTLALLAASVFGLGFLIATSDGLNDYQGRPLGTDFSNIYAGGTYMLDGQPGTAFDPPAQHARQQTIFGKGTPFYGWCYPPFLLFVAGALALLPYAGALFVWQFSTILLYLGMLWSILRFAPARESDGVALTRDRMWLLLALAYPAVFVNLGHGHNGFLTAALIGGGLLLLDRKPVVAGILFGLMSYKPQFGVMIPLVLMATGRWRAFMSATATVLMLSAISTLAFGVDVWRSMIEHLPFTQRIVLEEGQTGWYKIQSVFSWARMWGAGVPLAYGLQAAVTVTLGAALVWLWRSDASYRLKAAALPIASILATPYSLDYDLMALAPSMAFLAIEGYERGFRPYEKSALAFLWIMPLVTRTVAEQTLIPLGVPAMLLVFVLVMRRAIADTGTFPHWQAAAPSIK